MFDVKPTYLITYPVATSERAISIFTEILKAGKCEIGAHCHPWNTPPFEEQCSPPNSMLCNLPEDLQYRKMRYLHEAIREHFGIEPVCFRSGRWGYADGVARNLQKLGYKIDTSMTPYTDWTSCNGPDFTDISPQPFMFSGEPISQGSTNGQLVEVPATIGFRQQNFARCNRILKTVKRRPLNCLRLAGILYRLGVVNKVWLSPEVSSSEDMIRLAQNMMQNKYRSINMIFHSPSLKAGLSPFVRTKHDEQMFFRHLRDFLTFARTAGIQPIRLSEVLNLL